MFWIGFGIGFLSAVALAVLGWFCLARIADFLGGEDF